MPRRVELSYEDMVVQSLSEKGWQRQVFELLGIAGFDMRTTYHTWSSLHSPSGFPDIVALRQRDGVWTVLVVELKRWDGKVTPFQQFWLSAFEQIAGAVNVSCQTVHMEVGVWRPQDREAIWETIK